MFYTISGPHVGGYRFQCDGSQESFATEYKRWLKWGQTPHDKGAVAVMRHDGNKIEVVARF